MALHHFVENKLTASRQIKVAKTLTEVSGKLRFGPPKSKASKRTVRMPELLVEEPAQHLALYRDPEGWERKGVGRFRGGTQLE